MDSPMYPFLRAPRPATTLAGLLETYRRDARSAEAASRLALALHAQERPARALHYVRKAIRLDPQRAEAFEIEARILLAQERIEQAAHSLQRAIALDPGRADWYFALGKLYIRRLGDEARSLEMFKRGIAVDPANRFGYVGVGRCAIQGRNLSAARAYARTAMPGACPADTDLGVARALEHYGRYDEALECRAEIIRTGPEDTKTLNALARICDALGDRASALKYHERAFLLDARHGESFYYYLFKLREFDRARDVYWAAKPELLHFADRKNPAWHGRTVLLDSVGGYGDSVQFARFGALLKQRGARVILRCQKGFCSLASTMPGIDLAVAPYDQTPDIDCELVLFLETYLILGFDIEEALGQVPYLRPPRSACAKWAGRLPPDDKLKVGICWAGGGSSLHNRYAFRSIPLSQWTPLLEIPGVSWIGLQKGPVVREVARASKVIPLLNPGNEFRDFTDAAAALLTCDLVISVDTSIAHLAGALQKPVFTFIPHRCCYRWHLDTDESSWYPGMKLFRQERPGDWTGAILKAAQEVREFQRIRSAVPVPA